MTIKKYGKENFKVELIDTADNLNELTEKEYYYIKLYKSSIEYNNYNLLRNNDKGIFKHDDSSKKQISSTLKENYKTGKMTPYWKDKHLPKHMIDALDVSNKKWYTNGKNNIYLDKDSQIPDGYHPGRTGLLDIQYQKKLGKNLEKKL